MPGLNDIRSTFLNYFVREGHTEVPSGPLVPRNDPSLMFTNSGMVQFKSLFTGKEKREYCRATTSQKCVRAGGKHNDLENVGYTARHHTFFEMLGNFSFGNYFKEQAIYYCWNLVTREFDIPRDRLLVTVYHDDEDAVEYWKSIAGLTDGRIIRIATSDNFWSMGSTGPCGPCTELYFDYGDSIQGGPPGSSSEDGDRFVELWNLVFMQYEQFEDGSRIALPKPSIDTGMGLERVAALLQNTHDNYKTDLFCTLIEASAKATNTEPYGQNNTNHRVIVDHLRSSAFLIAEGVMPSKDGRGYVLRRIIRRAIRHVSQLGISEPVIYKLVHTLNQQMGTAFPELIHAEALVKDTIFNEELKFHKTLNNGLKLLENAIDELEENQPLSGTTAFKLYDTYGFPLDLTQDALRESGRTVNIGDFDQAMEQQRQKARASWAGIGETELEDIWYSALDEYGATEFLGYETEWARGIILALFAGSIKIECADAGMQIKIICNQSPFYAEAGGQVGDRGTLASETGKARVVTTTSFRGLIIHHCDVISGSLCSGSDVLLKVDIETHQKTRQNHSATHLLNAALRRELGQHVAQRGSLNNEHRLRFDYSHSASLSLDQIERVENTVNHYIHQNSVVETRVMELNEARTIGAQAQFGEKYDDELRVISMGHNENTNTNQYSNAFSIELCGGTHVKQTGEIGVFAIVNETASASGVRRIEALTCETARRYLSSQDHRLAKICMLLKTNSENVVERVSALSKSHKTLLTQLKATKKLNLGTTASGSTISSIEKEFSDGLFVGKILDSLPANELPEIIDQEKGRIGSGVVVIVSIYEKKAAIAVGVTSELTDQYSGVELIRQLTPILGGQGGGGRPDLARGGGPDITNVNSVISKARELIGGIK